MPAIHKQIPFKESIILERKVSKSLLVDLSFRFSFKWFLLRSHHPPKPWALDITSGSFFFLFFLKYTQPVELFFLVYLFMVYGLFPVGEHKLGQGKGLDCLFLHSTLIVQGGA